MVSISAEMAHVDIWIFDLDNTLYPVELNLFAQIEKLMVAYIRRELSVTADQAQGIRHDYWSRYGTTLAGLMAEHAIDPTAFLAEVHDIDFSALPPAPELADAIAALPGRKLVHTNGDSTYAGKILAARQLNVFDSIYGVEETAFHPKPRAEAYQAVIEQAEINPVRAAFFDDDPRNLLVPHQLGMQTILVGAGRDGPNALATKDGIGDHIRHRTNDLTAFLRGVAAA